MPCNADLAGCRERLHGFASNGPAGIEKFWTIINGYFNELLSYICGTGMTSSA
ncbi:hypothetical protein JKP88DRAFT_348649 [Tribonema minus]|uniref:Uncharacterized protein n=1 Tax=Tribonema minus TaxID=303371 RepID=A0A836CED5_9STRA|nr:hypothetical protein JKP88DRAFT_348649 [Tribonema minus]